MSKIRLVNIILAIFIVNVDEMPILLNANEAHFKSFNQ